MVEPVFEKVLLQAQKVRVLVVGDSGVGKTCLVHHVCHGSVLKKPHWTVGCSVEVKLHWYNGDRAQSFFVEFWDVGGSPRHEESRKVFLGQPDGLLLVHDLTNRKSFTNLPGWLKAMHDVWDDSPGSDPRLGRAQHAIQSNVPEKPPIGRTSEKRPVHRSVRSDASHTTRPINPSRMPVLVVGNKAERSTHHMKVDEDHHTLARDLLHKHNYVFYSIPYASVSVEPAALDNEVLHQFLDSVISHRWKSGFKQSQVKGTQFKSANYESHRVPK